MALIIPDGYRPIMGVRDTERAIPAIKDHFQRQLAKRLNLERASAPMFVRAGTGINDNLNGVERPVSFDIVGDTESRIEVVHSLAKWKRMALARYGYRHGEGIWTDMNAIRRDEALDNLHSIYVDQWDWERVISADERDLGFLRFIVDKVYAGVKGTETMIAKEYGVMPILPKRIPLISSEQLEANHPGLSRKERENVAAEAFGAFFLLGIGSKLKDGQPHDGRAPDYDDWSTKTAQGAGLNGDIIVWNPVLNCAFELSSMGIRVDKEALVCQLRETGTMDRLGLEFHKALTEDRLPLSIGGGIGQSRLCMFLLRKAHIGEVQAGIWPLEMMAELERHGIPVL